MYSGLREVDQYATCTSTSRRVDLGLRKYVAVWTATDLPKTSYVVLASLSSSHVRHSASPPSEESLVADTAEW